MPKLEYAGRIIPYDIERRSGRKTVSLYVDANRGVYVRAPFGIPDEQLQEIVLRKANWIIRKLDEVRARQAAVPKHRFVDGETFWYLGQAYPLVVHTETGLDQPRLTWDTQKFQLSIPRCFREENLVPTGRKPEDHPDAQVEETYRRLFRAWYLARGQAVVQTRLQRYGSVYGYPRRVLFKEQKTRWGSCAADGTIRLNWHILMAPMAILDYLLVHELAHLKHPNHSKHFWAAVAKTIPDYLERRRWLKEHGHLLTL
ncbi:MAG: M48 family metallopeptidase [Alicyclobacillus herbarius]|uniref:M48 family metallopeptidase n=1 Tax=Alicyclobacillus herbarius TaxID=122960 RepID=UPI00040F6176|nr:SprT family zinc-dependent metalloprotease [Alicyclobacillus herbarius]MCL6631321.1 M48 family metallopeptidase [Alicyclobacillus herbarius]